MRFLMLSLVALALVGCGDSSAHPVDEFVATGDAINAEVCSCPAFETEDFCTMPDELSAAEVSCLRRVYDEYEGELSGTVDCFIDAGDELNRCARDADCNLIALDTCNDVYEARVDGCPETTTVAGETFDDCIIE